MSSLDQLKDLSPTLAADLAADLIPADDVFKRHGIGTQDANLLMGSEWFRHMVDEARSEWSSLKNSKQRVRLKGQLALEEAIPEIYHMIHDTDIPAAARVAAFKELKEVSGVASGTQENGNAGTGLPSVTIILGGASGNSVTIEGTKAVTEAIEEANVLPGLEVLERDA
jgi:hypothetical protein